MKQDSEPPRLRVTAEDVAQLAGVSTGTVSRVVNGHPAVTEEVRQRVTAAMGKLGWQPNVIARSMRTSTTRTIGCIFSNIRNPLYAAIIQGAEEAFARENYTLMVASSGESSEREAVLINLFAARRTDGLILSIADETSRQVIDAVKNARLPTVLIERDLPTDTFSVGTDHRRSMITAIDYLFSLGHRRIALVTGGKKTRAGRERVGGFVDAYKAANLELDTDLLRVESLASDYAFHETQALMRLPGPPTAIIAGGNLMLAGVLRAAHMMEISVPRDLSIICSGDTELAELATPPITAIRWDLAGVGREAARLLLAHLSGSQKATRIRIELPNEMVLRKSCAPPSRIT
jgi:LacI family transcriptional regulator